MANVAEKWEDSIPGNYYVDKSCIFCNLCMEVAPKNFKESDQGDHDIVYKQPASEEEFMQCKDAVEQCPVEAIGTNGG